MENERKKKNSIFVLNNREVENGERKKKKKNSILASNDRQEKERERWKNKRKEREKFDSYT